MILLDSIKTLYSVVQITQLIQAEMDLSFDSFTVHCMAFMQTINHLSRNVLHIKYLIRYTNALLVNINGNSSAFAN